MPAMVGQDYDSVVAALKAKGIAYQEQPAASGKKITYGSAGENVALEFSMWPKDPDAPPSAWESGSAAPRRLTLTHVQDLAPGSDQRRAWVRSFEKDGRRWGYVSDKAAAARPAEERARYPVAAYLQWIRPKGASGQVTGSSVTFLFQAARQAGTPPGNEMTALDIFLENPHRPRRF